jgi:hypothetical protein
VNDLLSKLLQWLLLTTQSLARAVSTVRVFCLK